MRRLIPNENDPEYVMTWLYNGMTENDPKYERSCWKKKKKKKEEEKNKNSQAHSGGCSSEEKNRNSPEVLSNASETFKERSKEKFWTVKCQLWSTLCGGGVANAILEVEHFHFILILFTLLYLLY